VDTRIAADPAQRLPARGAARSRLSRLALALVLGAAAAPLAAQDDAPAPEEAEETARRIDFEARELAYNSESDIVTARGDVILRSEDRSVRADEVIWDRNTGRIIASGNIRLVDEAGNQLFTDQVELTE